MKSMGGRISRRLGEGQPYFAQQVELLYSYLPLSQTAAIINGLFLLYFLRGHAPALALWLWSASLVLLSLFRLWMVRAYRRRRSQDSRHAYWGWFFLSGLWAAGLVWGAAPVFLFPPASLVHQTILAFVLGGIATGSIAVLSSIPLVVRSFLALILLPLLARFAMVGDAEHYGMAGLILLFFVSMLVASRLVHRTVMTSLALGHENESQRQVLAQQAVVLEERAARLQSILDNTVDSIITLNERGEVLTYNRAAEVAFGFSAQEILGRPISLLLPRQGGSASHARWEAHWRQCLSGCAGETVELTMLRKYGEPFMVEVNMSRTVLDGEPVCTGIFRDITERKKVERIKSEFISTVSHELRTPLTSIRGALGLIGGGAVGEVSEQARALVTVATSNSDRLSHLINDILDMEKLESGMMSLRLSSHALMPLIERTLEANTEFARLYGVRLHLADGLPGVHVLMDPDRIGQVLTNLISNAVKFSPKGQVVSIEVRAVDGYVRTSVHDQGVGVPEAFRSRIFQKFSQADGSDQRSAPGTGLGLSICKAIIDRHHGVIDYDSEPGQGATFYFELPKARRQAEAVANA